MDGYPRAFVGQAIYTNPVDDPSVFGQGHEDEPGVGDSPDSSGIGGLPPLQDPYVQVPYVQAPDSAHHATASVGGHERAGQATDGAVGKPPPRRGRVSSFLLPAMVVVAGVSAVALVLSQVGSMAGLWGEEVTSRRVSYEDSDDRDEEDEDEDEVRPRNRLTKPAPPAPPATHTEDVGDITVVDIGVEVDSLEDALLAQRDLARKDGERVMVMTIQADCEPCEGVANSLSDPLMQDALDGIRLVRVNINDFWRELGTLNMFHDVYPGYFLLSPDLTPADAINGGEWGEDIAENIAPVLGPFVRGEYDDRKSYWKSPRRGIRL